MTTRKAAAFLVTAYLAFTQTYVLGQETQSPSKDMISDILSSQAPRRTVISDQRSNYCEIAKQVELGNVDAREALKGFNVSIGLSEPIDDGQEKVSLKLLDEIARRGQFHYKDSAEFPRPTGNDTYTDTLIYTLDNYDVAASYWIRSAERTALGITGTVGWFDASTIMIRTKVSSSNFRITAVFDPFESDVWYLIAGTIIASGIAYHSIDYMIHRGNAESNDGIGGNLFKSTLAFMGDNTYDPKFTANRILLVSMSFLSLILVAAYTANLASFLVADKNNTSIKNFDDVIKNKYNVCVQKGTMNTVAIQNDYPKANYVEKEEVLEVYQGLFNNDCQVALISVDEHRGYENDKKYNKNCALEVVGLPVHVHSASFALKSSVEYCSPLLRDVLDIFMLEIIHDGTLEKIKKNAYEGSQECDAESGESDSGSLNLKDLGGIFIMYYVLLIFTLLLTALHTMFHNVVASSIDKMPMVRAVSSCIRNKISCLFKRDKDERHQCDEDDIEANGATYNRSLNSIKLASTEYVIKKMYKEVLKMRCEMGSQISEIKTTQEKMVKSQAQMQMSQAQIFQRRPKREVYHIVESTQGEF